MQNVKSYRPSKPRRSRTPKRQKTSSKFNIGSNQKVRLRRIASVTTSVILVCGLGLSIFKIVEWCIEKNHTDEQITSLQSSATIETDSGFMNVDLSESIALNDDTVGWIAVPGTAISYPFLQSDNNEYYLNHSISGEPNSAGWIFLDYRNSSDLNDQNQIIYGHGRLDGSMFGTLKNVLTPEWQADPNNHIVQISTPYQNQVWQVFSVYEISTTDDYLTTNFGSDAEFQNFLDLITKRSAYNFHNNASVSDNIITLSTCTDAEHRAVLHAKLAKIAKK